eukprot:1195819-Prorocentrum_minimum.AAC.9
MAVQQHCPPPPHQLPPGCQHHCHHLLAAAPHHEGLTEPYAPRPAQPLGDARPSAPPASLRCSVSNHYSARQQCLLQNIPLANN